MQRRQGWLFPMMVVAAASMIAFGCLGIAAITGRLMLPPMAPAPLDEAAGRPGPLRTADAQAPGRVAPSAGATPNPGAPTHAVQSTVSEHGQPVVRN